MAYMTRFKSLANVFLSQLKTVPNGHMNNYEIMCNIIYLPLYKSIYKFFHSNLRFQILIRIFA